MTSLKLSVAKIYTGEIVLKNQTVEVVNGEIVIIRDCLDDEVPLEGLLVPGFIDVQVNGGGGLLFNSKPEFQTLQGIAKAHQQFGTTGWLPTLVTDSVIQMQRAADAVSEYRGLGNTDVLGIHFEGPFISREKKGVHSESLIRCLNDKDMSLLTRTDLGKVLLTVAPENVAPESIKELTAEGVVVALGHSNASYEQTIEALDAGATGFTHLYNAMSQLGSRAPGMVGTALTTNNNYSGIILDGIHVHPAAARVAYASQTQLMLVTDAMPPVGSLETQFEFLGQTIYRQSDRLCDSDGRLAGAVLDMNTAVNNAMRFLEIDLFTAIDLATKAPAQFLLIDESYGQLKPGYRANMTMLNESNQVISTWLNGQLVY